MKTHGIGGFSAAADEVALSHFNLFEKPEYETGVKDFEDVIVRPINSSNLTGPWSFHIPKDPNRYSSTETLRLKGKLRVRKKQAGTLVNLPDNEQVSTINDMFKTIWGNIKTKVNDVEIGETTSKWYSYKAYLEDTLSYSKATKLNVLSSRGYFKDTAGKFDTIPAATEAITDAQNAGYKKRAALIAKSKWVYFKTNLHIDICTLKKYLPPNMAIDLEFEKVPTSFYILSPSNNNEYEVELDGLELSMRRFTPSDYMKNWIENERRLKIAQNPMDSNSFKAYTVAPGTNDLSSYGIIKGHKLPDQLLVGLVEEESYRGVNNKNPFNFQHFDLLEASVVINGTHFPANKFKMDRSIGDTAEIYQHFLECCGIGIDDREFDITSDDYLNGTFLLNFDFSPDLCNRYHRHIPNSGNIDVNLKLKNETDKTVKVILYATYATDVYIDNNTNVMIEQNF